MERLGTVNLNPQSPLPAPATRRTEGAPLALEDRFVSSDMAQMLEDLQRAEALYRQAAPAPVPVAPRLHPQEATAPVGGEHAGPGHQAAAHALTGAHLVLEAGELAAQGAGLLGSASQGAAGSGHAASTAHGHAGAEALAHGAGHSSTLTSAMMVGGVVGSALVGAGMVALAVHQVREGLRTGEKELLVEAAGSAVLGMRSGAAAVALAGHGASGALGAVAHGAHGLLAPLGVLHGAIDVGLGVHEIARGIQEKDTHQVASGALGVGFGTAILTAALGGGLPAVATAGALLVARVGHEALSGGHN